MSLFWLGLKALTRERTLLLFTSTGLAAVLGPLLLLYGFKFGVIAALLTAMREDPTNREIGLKGNYTLLAADIEKYRAFPGMEFLVPNTRVFSGLVELVGPGERPPTTQASLMSSAPGDPLLPRGMEIKDDEIALSSELAEKLRVKVGDHVKGRNHRTFDNTSEDIIFEFTVKHVVDQHFTTGDRAYVTLPVLLQVEAFLEGYEVPELKIEGKPIGERTQAFASMRMYARTIEGVPELDKLLTDAGLSVFSKAREVAGILQLNKSLDAVFGLIAAIGSVGYAVSLTASLLGNLAHQRKLLSLIRLMGAGRGSLLLFPLAQGLAVALLGFGLSVCLFEGVAWLANQRFAAQMPIGGEVCRLDHEHFLAALGGTLAIVGLVIAWVGRTLLTVTPAEVLHAE